MLMKLRIGVTHAGHGCFLLRAHEDKEGNENEEGIVEESDNTEGNGQGLSDSGGDLCRAKILHLHIEYGAQNPAAIHGESGNEIEENEADVHRSEFREHCDARSVYIVKVGN